MAARVALVAQEQRRRVVARAAHAAHDPVDVAVFVVAVVVVEARALARPSMSGVSRLKWKKSECSTVSSPGALSRTHVYAGSKTTGSCATTAAGAALGALEAHTTLLAGCARDGAVDTSLCSAVGIERHAHGTTTLSAVALRW